MTVGDGDSSNQAPVASSDIPDHSVRMGASVTVDGSNYFSDPDGDDLTYTASSSNDEVATVAVDGSVATITAVAVGSAVVTMTASDGSADASQGFGVTVTEESTIKEATVTIFGLREVTDRNAAVDPTSVSGDVTVLLDVQPNDENVTAIDLTLGDMMISCRGTSSDGATPVGLANSGGAVEVECFFDTDAVMGYCEGMQLDPQFANGEHELGARITVADGGTRDALATQMLTLNNSNYVMIDHNPGGTSLVVGGVTYYGGPSSEENLNTFDVCPVAFDGTVVGSIGLRGETTTPDGRSVSFLTHRPGRYGEFYGVRRTDSEAPFTWTALSTQNAHIEDVVDGGSGGHMIIQDGVISDPDGLDISDKFMPGDAAEDHTAIGPIFLDFAAPRLGGADAPSEVVIGGASVEAGTYYSDVSRGRAQSVAASNITEAGSGGARGIHNQVIAVGDCSVGANADTGRLGAGTPFVAVVDDANVIGDIPEDDAEAGELSDDGGVDCYVAELQSATDPLGNSTFLGATRIRSAGHFGVDRGAPVIDDEQPDEVLALKADAMLTFEVEEPDLETGEPGSGLDNGDVDAWAGSSNPGSNRVYWTHETTVDDGLVTVPTVVGRSSRGGDEEGRHTVYVRTYDMASPPNSATTSFTFIRDTKSPTFVVSKSQSDIGFTNSPSVLASVGGVISDGSVIQKAELSLRKVAAAGDACAQGDTLSQGRTGRVARNKRDLENDTNSITFDETFTIRRDGDGMGAETYCFFLEVEDSAVDSDGRGDGNSMSYDVGQFSVHWPGTPPTPPGPTPTFAFQTADDNTSPTTFTDADSLSVAEGTEASANMGYWVRLKDVATAPTATAPLSVTVSAPAGLTATPTTLSLMSATDSALVTLAAAHDLNLTSELHMVSHTATGYGAASFPVRVTDDDFMLSASVGSVTEDADSATVIITLTAATAPTDAAGTTLTVGATESSGAAAGDFRVTGVGDMTVPMSMTSVIDTVYVTAIDDAEMDEDGEAIQFAVSANTDVNGVYVAPTSITIIDVDPDITVSLSHTELDEGSGATVVTVTAELGAPAPGILSFTIGDVAACAAVETSVAGPAFRIDTGGMSASGTVTVTPVADIDDANTDCDVPVTVAPAAKANAVNWTLQDAEVTIVNEDDSES